MNNYEFPIKIQFGNGFAYQYRLPLKGLTSDSLTEDSIFILNLNTVKIEIKNAITNIKQNKFQHYYIHIKQTDIPGHDGRPKDKVKMIEILDKKLLNHTCVVNFG